MTTKTWTRWAVALLSIGGLLGCEAERAKPQGWSEGKAYRYDLSIHTRVNGMASVMPLSDFTVSAQPVFQLLTSTEKGATLRLELENVAIKTMGGTSANEQGLAQYQADLERPYEVEMQGGIASALWIPKGANPMAVAMVRTLVSTLQRAEPAEQGAKKYEAEEYDATGQYSATYQVADDGAVQKRKQRYTKVLAVSGEVRKTPHEVKEPEAEVVASTIEMAVLDGVVQQIEASERVKVPMPTGAYLSSKTELSLKLVSVKDADAAGGRQAGLVRLPADRAYAKKPGLEDLDAARIGDLTFDQVLGYLEQIANEFEPGKLNDADTDPTPEQEALGKLAEQRNRYFTALAAMFRQQPMRVEEAAQRVRDGSSAAGWLINGLGAAGTAKAQNMLAELVQDGALSIELRKSASLSLMQTNRPTVETAHFVESLLDSPQWSEFAVYALGSLSRRLRDAGNEKEADRLTAVLLTQLSTLRANGDEQGMVLVLHGLSNAADPSALGAMEPLLTGKSEAQRHAAVQVLRLIETPEADALLVGRMQDTAVGIREVAVRLAGGRTPPADRLFDAVSSAALSDSVPKVRLAAVRTLGEWLPTTPKARAVVESVVEKEEEEVVKLFAVSVLEGTDA